MKRLLALAVLLLMIPLAVLCDDASYPDGIYRGFYYDGGIEQIAVQFQLEGGIFTSIVYRSVRYKDGNYMSENAGDAQKAAYQQYLQMAEHLIGKGISAIDDLYTPYNFVEDLDAVTTATIQSSKLISALWDGLNRHPFRLIDTSVLPAVSAYADGIYRGSYMEEGSEEVGVEFTLKDGIFSDVHYHYLGYHGTDFLAEDASEPVQAIAGQFRQLAEYLNGKPVSAVNDLYLPENIAGDTDVSSGATIRSPKVISAIWDALNRRVYQQIP